MAKLKKPPIQILGAQHYDAVVAELKRLEEVPEGIRQACSMGIDCTEYEAILAQSKTALERILKEIFPMGRPR